MVLNLVIQKKSPQQLKLIADFCQMTAASSSQAQHFLGRSKYNFQESINLFFDEGTNAQKKQIEHTKEIDQLFNVLSNSLNGVREVDEEKFSQFIDSYFHVNEENLIIPHILINIMKVQKSGHITIHHFYNLFQHLNCQSPADLCKHVQQLEQQIYKDKQNFKTMYLKTFNFYLYSKDTTLQYDLAFQIWKLYLKNFMTFYNQFIQYCQSSLNKPKKVHRDLWKMVYEFATTVKQIKNVKQDDGWPVFLDEFVQYVQKKQTKTH